MPCHASGQHDVHTCEDNASARAHDWSRQLTELSDLQWCCSAEVYSGMANASPNHQTSCGHDHPSSNGCSAVALPSCTIMTWTDVCALCWFLLLVDSWKPHHKSDCKVNIPLRQRQVTLHLHGLKCQPTDDDCVTRTGKWQRTNSLPEVLMQSAVLQQQQ